MDTIILELRAVDFFQTSYTSNNNCAISKAYKRQINKDADISTTSFDVDLNQNKLGEKHYKIKGAYLPHEFWSDQDDAIKADFSSDVVVRKITLTEQKVIE